MASERFKEWIQTPIGCDGGNINGATWFFGIEYGGSEKSLEWIDKDKIDMDHSFIDGAYRENFPDAYQYNNKLVKLYSSILGIAIERYIDVFRITNMFGECGEDEPVSDTYKGNIFTLAFPDIKDSRFTSEFIEATGCSNKEKYRQLHRDFRFPILRSWVGHHSPKVIVCFGTSDHILRDYIRAFYDADGNRNRLKLERVEDVSVYYANINDNKTLLIVVPFIAYYANCLNSDKRIRAVGRKIRGLAIDSFGNSWSRYSHLDLSMPSRLQDGVSKPNSVGSYISTELKRAGIDCSEGSLRLGITANQLARLINGGDKLSSEIALRLALATGTSIETWLERQMALDVWDQLKNIESVQIKKRW